MAKTLLDRVLDFARDCEDVRAVTMEGSRTDAHALKDRYSDYDVCFYVRDIRRFTQDKSWVKTFGDPVIMQCAEDCLRDYDYESREPYIFMMQFADESRVDLGLKDLGQIDREYDFGEPRQVLINKDNFPQLRESGDNSCYFVKKPTEKEYADCCNEFRWVSLYVAKGLCRRQLPYAMHHFGQTCMRQLMRMLAWRAAAPQDFRISVGAGEKYLEKYLPAEIFAQYRDIFPHGDYAEIWEKLFLMYDLFAACARFVAAACSYPFNTQEDARVRAFLEKRFAEKED